MQPVSPRIDPAPSRWAYRFQRLMLTPLFRKLLRVGLPFCVAFGAGTAYFADQDRADAFNLAVADLRHQVETRPEFMVELMAVEGASQPVEEDIREIFPYELPITSFDMDLAEVQQLIEDLPAVQSAAVRIRQGGVLEAKVTERTPVVLWRNRDGLGVLDQGGVVISDAISRTDHPELPIIAGDGADAAVPEALQILRAATPLGPRLRGLVRMGERRWDVVLDRDQRIMLPEANPVRALERVIVLDQTQDMLARDLVAVDMRLAARPTLRLSSAAVENWWQVSTISLGLE